MNGNQNRRSQRQFSLTRAFVTSLISSFFFMLSLVFSIFVFGILKSGISSNPIMVIASFMLVLTLCGSSLFGPAYYETRKFGWFEGLITLVLSALLTITIIFLFFFIFGSSGGTTPIGTPMG